MPAAMRTSRTQLWLDNLGEWSWPGRAAEAVESLPPSWVPAFPPRLEPAPSGAPLGAWEQPRATPRVVGASALLSALAAMCAMLALYGPLRLEGLLGLRSSASAARRGEPGRRGQLDRQGELCLHCARGQWVVSGLPAARLRQHDASLPGPLSASRQRSARRGLSAARAAERARPADRQARDTAGDRGDDPRGTRREQLAQPEQPPL